MIKLRPNVKPVYLTLDEILLSKVDVERKKNKVTRKRFVEFLIESYFEKKEGKK